MSIDGFVGFHHACSKTSIAQRCHHALGIGLIDETAHHHTISFEGLTIDDSDTTGNGAYRYIVHHDRGRHNGGYFLLGSNSHGLRVVLLFLSTSSFIGFTISAFLRATRREGRHSGTKGKGENDVILHVENDFYAMKMMIVSTKGKIVLCF